MAEGVQIATERDLRPNLVTLERSRARLWVLQPGKQHQALGHYQKALSVALGLRPTPRLVLRHLAEDIMEYRPLFQSNKCKYSAYQKDLANAVKEFAHVQRPRQTGQRRRRQDRRRRAKDLEHLLGLMLDTRVGATPLQGCTLRQQESGLYLDSPAGSVQIQLKRAAIVDRLLRAGAKPISAAELAYECKSSPAYVQHTMTWLRKNGADGALEVEPRTGQHGHAFYRLIRAPE